MIPVSPRQEFDSPYWETFAQRQSRSSSGEWGQALGQSHRDVNTTQKTWIPPLALEESRFLIPLLRQDITFCNR
jgi:hypothetical protein